MPTPTQRHDRPPAALRPRAPLERVEQAGLLVLRRGRAGAAAATSDPDPRVDEGVREVGEQVRRAITSTPKRSVSAEIVGKSRISIDETSSEPSPGIAKTFSITTLPLIR